MNPVTFVTFYTAFMSVNSLSTRVFRQELKPVAGNFFILAGHKLIVISVTLVITFSPILPKSGTVPSVNPRTKKIKPST